jgi:hypothetical protein
LLKTFRKNILDNKNWPDEPGNGWIVPDNWYTKVNDIIRTLIIVKYLDGVDFVQERIGSLCDRHLTTQLQEVIRKLLHKYYEDRRKEPGEKIPSGSGTTRMMNLSQITLAIYFITSKV